MEIKKTSMQAYVIKFIFKISFCFISSLLAIFLIFSYMINSHILLPSNYSQQMVEKSKENIKNAKEVTSNLIPENLNYIILDKQTLNVKKGSMSDSEIKKAKLSVKDPQIGINVYEVIDRSKEYCIIHYQLVVQFKNPILRKLVPYPEIALLVLFIIILLTALYILSLQFSNRIKNELSKFSYVTEKIEKQDLDFEVQNVYFIEHQRVMDSLDSLRYSLKKSLTIQFEQEKNKGEQISALAHDIKIPITVIKGNAELLNLTQKDEKALDFINEIMEATGEIEHYTQFLIDASKNDETFVLHKEKVTINEFLNIIEKDTLSSIGNSNIGFNFNNKIPNELMFNIDCMSMKRAFMNIIINAIEYTKDVLTLDTYLKDNLAYFIITDSGDGFSPEALKKATELFYTDNKSRSQTGHYGIGLSFANKVIKAHNGKLNIQNDVNNGGGQVIISLPIELD
ncbi:sensor histidine kinase [Clostridium scatologenes]|nr:HAMP domain-containing sensor histidine kinase [Clostridium scatologenes]